MYRVCMETEVNTLYGYRKVKGLSFEEISAWLCRKDMPYTMDIANKPSEHDKVILIRQVKVQLKTLPGLLEHFGSGEPIADSFLYKAAYSTRNQTAVKMLGRAIDFIDMAKLIERIKPKTIYEHTFVSGAEKLDQPLIHFWERQAHFEFEDGLARIR
jgi:hypothetical protein